MKGKNILINGVGLSGISSAKLCASLGAKVYMVDEKPLPQLADKLSLLNGLEIKFYSKEVPKEVLSKMEMVVNSPGIPLSSPFLQKIIRLGIEIIGELELGYRYCKGNIIAITGTNGKTTTTTMIGDLFKQTNKNKSSDTYVLGNIGDPFAKEVVNIKKNDIVVLECSAGQLETINYFNPKISVITNIKSEHFNYYKDVNYYFLLKERITLNHNKDDYCILNYDDERCREIGKETKAKVVFISKYYELDEGVIVKDNFVISKYHNEEIKILDVKNIKLPGIIYSTLATVAVGIITKLPIRIIRDSIIRFEGIEHCLEYVNTISGIDFYNDSKATNPWSTLHAIDVINNKQITLILGGKDDKNSDFNYLCEKIKDKVKNVILIGQTSQRIANSLEAINYTNYTIAKNLEEALNFALKLSLSNEIILFSPGANSKDMFIDHKHRGNLFKDLINNLMKEESTIVI